MDHIEGTFKSVRDNKIYYQAWLPDGDVKAVLFLVHGLGEHSGRYSNLLNHFLPLGYAVYGLDHLGHGKSDGDREIVKSFSDYTDTLKLYFELVKGWQPDKPIFIYGHSMGGLITCDYLLNHQGNFKGAIISAPAIKVSDTVSSVAITMGKILSVIAPKTGVLGLDISGISRNPEVVSAYENDPLVFQGKTPARLAAELLKTMIRVTEEVKKITLPFIVVQGSGDAIVDPGGAQLLYDNAGSEDKTLKIYEGAYHEVHNEPEKATMFNDVETWLEGHI